MHNYRGVLPDGYLRYIKAMNIEEANDIFRGTFGDWPDMIEEVQDVAAN